MSNTNNKISTKEINWEKIGAYFIAVGTFFTVIFYVIDMKVDIAKIQVKVEQLEKK